jgi:hypothetical protein
MPVMVRCPRCSAEMRSPLGNDTNSGVDWVAGGINDKEFDCPVGHTFTFMGEDVYWVE